MIYVYAKYQKPTPYIKRDIANVKVWTDGRTDGRTESPLHRLTLHLHVSQKSNVSRNFLYGLSMSSSPNQNIHLLWVFFSFNNQPTWACLVTCIHYILDFGVVKSKLNLHLYITGSFYTVVFLYRIFFLVSYIAVMNLANCLTFGSVINDSISFMVWLAVWSKSYCRLSA